MAKLARFAGDENIRMPLLSDAQARIIPAFGVENDRFPKGSSWYGVAHPIIIVADADGIVRHRFSKRNYRDRPDVDAVLDVLRKAAGS